MKCICCNLSFCVRGHGAGEVLSMLDQCVNLKGVSRNILHMAQLPTEFSVLRSTPPAAETGFAWRPIKAETGFC